MSYFVPRKRYIDMHHAFSNISLGYVCNNYSTITSARYVLHAMEWPAEEATCLSGKDIVIAIAIAPAEELNI